MTLEAAIAAIREDLRRAIETEKLAAQRPLRKGEMTFDKTKYWDG